MGNGVLAVRPTAALSDEQFARPADVSPEAELYRRAAEWPMGARRQSSLPGPISP
jgi:hypothetical protein